MSPEKLITTRELNSRVIDGVHVRLLWGSDDGRLWVSVLNTRNGDRFSVNVAENERPMDVFHHPFAYAAHHGVDVGARRSRAARVEIAS